MKNLRLPLLLSLLVPAACAAPPAWVNPSLPRAIWNEDLAACRHQADDALGPSAWRAPGDERKSDPMSRYDQNNDQKRYQALVEICMRAKGYVPAR